MSRRLRRSLKAAAAGSIALAATWILGLGTSPAQQPEPTHPGHQHAPAAQQAASDASPLPRPVVETHDLMNLFSKQLYQYMRRDVHRIGRGEVSWPSIADRGLQTAEVANLIAMRQQDPKWLELSADLQRAGLALNQAAKRQNADQVVAAYRQVIARCNGCHEVMAPEHAPQLEP